jgi:ribosome-binding protein aMBF1 (putative translation factor)
MPCNRCGGQIEKFELQGRVASVCKECGSLDVLVEHEPAEKTSESWSDAIARFNEQSKTTTRTVETIDVSDDIKQALSDD